MIEINSVKIIISYKLIPKNKIKLTQYHKLLVIPTNSRNKIKFPSHLVKSDDLQEILEPFLTPSPQPVLDYSIALLNF